MGVIDLNTATLNSTLPTGNDAALTGDVAKAAGNPATTIQAGAVGLATSKVTGTLPVANGGTGVASTTAFAVVCGGTTTTNPLQPVAALGASGTVLTSNGAGTLPTFQTVAAGNTLSLTETTTPSTPASGTITLFAKTTGVTPNHKTQLCVIDSAGVTTVLFESTAN